MMSIMKRLVLALSLALAAPALALAQQASPAPGGGGMPGMWGHGHQMSDADRAKMQQNMQQMQQLHKQFRADCLAALTPAHKQLLASVIGALATSADPDEKAAAAQLDAALSDGEKNAILAAAQKAHDQMKAMMASMRPSPAPGASPKPRPSPRATMGHDMTDPGQILLMIAPMYGDRLTMMLGGMHGR
jgi:Spy/CpxP family protein refolding chaperone